MPKAFVVGDKLPATTQLKIAWTTNFPIAHEYTDILIYIQDYSTALVEGVQGEEWHDIYTEINGIRVGKYDSLEANYTWESNCGDDGTSSCGTDKWIIIDTSGWSESKRTIIDIYSVNWLSNVGLTYEDLNAEEEPSGTSNITVGNQTLKKAFVGSGSVAKMFIGDTLVYDKAGEEPPIEEGNYVIFENEDGSTISVTPNWTQLDVEIQYSFNGSDWSSATAETEIENTTGNQIAFRGKAPTDKRLFTDMQGTNAWVCADTTKITGNLNFLLCDDFGDETAPTTLADYCYTLMFYECTSLTTAPSLPATTLGIYCYYFMFLGCTSLTTAPSLPAITLANNCYSGMFNGCTSLTTAPSLPATTIAFSCYNRMFENCTALTTAPSLPATTLEISCYRVMFNGCTSFKVSATETGDYIHAWRIPTSGTGTTASDWNKDMLSGTTGTFTDDPEIDTTYYIENEPV